LAELPVEPRLGSAYHVNAQGLVYGVHWSPAPGRTEPANLDAICELRDANGAMLEAISPDRLSSTNGSVIHTGDSRTGASAWDDERVFVFLEALPAGVRRLDFRVVSRDGHRLCDVPGAWCHVSDYRTEDELLNLKLTAQGPAAECLVAVLERQPAGWTLRAR
jgi:tellurium resistance protein TerZ